MSTVFSGGSYVYDAAIDGSSKNNLIYAGASSHNIEAALTAAGWSVVSGSGTNNLLMQSAQDPTTGLQCRVRFKDNSGTCVQVTIESASGSPAMTSSTTAGASLLPAAAKVYRILASRYRFEIFTAGTSVAREFVCAGMLWIPAPYQGVITEAIYLQGNATSDSDATVRGSFRAGWGSSSPTGGNNGGMSAVILNGALASYQGGSNQGASGNIVLRVPSQPIVTAYVAGSGALCYQNAYRWHDGALDQADALMAFGTAASLLDEALLRGQVYDWTVLSDAMAIDNSDSWPDGGSSHNFYCLMSSAGSAIMPRGSIWVATS